MTISLIALIGVGKMILPIFIGYNIGNDLIDTLIIDFGLVDNFGFELDGCFFKAI